MTTFVLMVLCFGQNPAIPPSTMAVGGFDRVACADAASKWIGNSRRFCTAWCAKKKWD